MRGGEFLNKLELVDPAFLEEAEARPSAVKRRSRGVRWAVAAGLAAAMIVTAVAAGPAISEALQKALGGFIPYAQPLEGVVEDKGFRLEIFSALTDANNAVVYAQLTDLKGDRLESVKAYGQLELPLEGETGYGYGCSVESYDPETKTALLRFNKDAGVLIPDGAEGEIVLYSVQPGFHTFSTQSIPVEHIPNAYLDVMTLPTGERVLIPEQNPLDLAGEPGREGAHLSSAGFAADGRLHYLTRFPEGTAPEHCNALVTTYSKSWKSPKEGGDTFFNHDFQTVAFTYEGAAYYDFSTVAALSDWDNLKGASGAYGYYVTGEKVEFDEPLRLPVKLSVVDAVTSPISGLIDNNTLQSLRLSSLGATVFSTAPDYTLIEGYPLTVFLSDGASFHPEEGMHGRGSEDGPNMARWAFDRPVEVDQVTGVAIGAWMIPVENGTAGEGYWLPELPE